LKFRRQHPLGRFIADFYCTQLGLVVEVDGGIHQHEEVRLRDEERDRWMHEHGLSVVRIDADLLAADKSRVIELLVRSGQQCGGKIRHHG
jgi:very-short-patch-repair endonuclease